LGARNTATDSTVEDEDAWPVGFPGSHARMKIIIY
jgi:hypothetical protein